MCCFFLQKCNKWNSFRMIKLINQKYVEHQSIVDYESVSIRFDKIMPGSTCIDVDIRRFLRFKKSETHYFNFKKPLLYYYITGLS